MQKDFLLLQHVVQYVPYAIITIHDQDTTVSFSLRDEIVLTVCWWLSVALGFLVARLKNSHTSTGGSSKILESSSTMLTNLALHRF